VTPPPKALGKVDVPPRDYGAELIEMRGKFALEDERLNSGLLSLEKRYYDLAQSFDELSAHYQSLSDRVSELEDGQRPSALNADFESRVLQALERNKSKPPDVEIRDGTGRSLRGTRWVVAFVAVCAVLFAALWNGDELIRAMK